MAHKKSKSITIKGPSGRWINIPTVVRSVSVLPQFAKQLFKEGRTRAVGGKSYGTRAAAMKAAGLPRREIPSERTISL